MSTALWKNIYTGLFFAINGFYFAIILLCFYNSFSSAVLQWIRSPYTCCINLWKGGRGRSTEDGERKSHIELKSIPSVTSLVAAHPSKSHPHSPSLPGGTNVGDADRADPKLETVNPLHSRAYVCGRITTRIITEEKV